MRRRGPGEVPCARGSHIRHHREELQDRTSSILSSPRNNSIRSFFNQPHGLIVASGSCAGRGESASQVGLVDTHLLTKDKGWRAARFRRPNCRRRNLKLQDHSLVAGREEREARRGRRGRSAQPTFVPTRCPERKQSVHPAQGSNPSVSRRPCLKPSQFTPCASLYQNVRWRSSALGGARDTNDIAMSKCKKRGTPRDFRS